MEQEQEKISRRLHHFLTEYDRKQLKKKSYNPRALGIYFEAAERCMEEIKRGVKLEKALDNCFNDQLLDFLKKNV